MILINSKLLNDQPNRNKTPQTFTVFNSIYKIVYYNNYLLIIKNNTPKWNPPRIEDVTEQRVLSFFRPLPKNENLPM